MSADGRPTLSVVVLAYRNKDTVEAAVGSIMDQRSDEHVEIILVASGMDGAAERARRRFPDVRVIESPERLLPGAARNRGVAAARSGVVAFLAADCRAELGWIQNRLAAHRSGVRAVASAMTNAGPRTPWGWGAYFAQYCARLPGRPRGPVGYPDGAAHGLSIDTDLLRTLGPYPEDVLIGEDTEMARRLRDASVEILFEPRVRTAHVGTPGFIGTLRDQFERGRRRGAAATPRWPRVSTWRFVLKCGRWGLGQVAWRLELAWEHAGDRRWLLLATSPFVVAAVAANHSGWVAGQLAARPSVMREAETPR